MHHDKVGVILYGQDFLRLTCTGRSEDMNIDRKKILKQLSARDPRSWERKKEIFRLMYQTASLDSDKTQNDSDTNRDRIETQDVHDQH